MLNAFSEKLAVSTMHGDDCHEVIFARGGIIKLLTRRSCTHPFGINWLTYRPDATIVTSDALSPRDVHAIAARIRPDLKGTRIRVCDRMTESPW
ncbi:MAG: hypothetical protein FWD68_21515 [Alphaproteobacteria bacterium]|nr:hypothetical protein [Alphaproteobacteria bacterium]